MKTTTKQTPVDFFYEHAGYSYDPKCETQNQGRRRCARGLAKAEAKASKLGFTFEWDYDGMDSSDKTKLPGNAQRVRGSARRNRQGNYGIRKPKRPTA